MKTSIFTMFCIILMLCFILSSPVSAVIIDTVTVCNVGNAGEISGGGLPSRITGAVDYVYSIGKFEVTAGQYCDFLNAVASTDTYGLYNTKMWDDSEGCKIQRSNSPGNYSYSIGAEWEDRPVNFVSWADAARFCNWLHNGQPTGIQDSSTTEDGSYFLNGATTESQIMAVVRKIEATWVIPSEDEWYKAAYHKNDGPTGNYFDYPTGTDDLPSNDLIDPDPGNNANFLQGGYTIGSPYWRTKVGEFENSPSPYGTFDQGGNVWEWVEEAMFGSSRGIRGGSYLNDAGGNLQAEYRNIYSPLGELENFGFRVVVIPEPVTFLLLGFGMIILTKTS